ncbi:MFS transporter [Aureimonas flava]|uniref:MFS transporter n=1 Tax=Aureimonas flava TaxID=2320271 RepID=A0A3A1WRL5_9HYPH|nr:MFS transporter [Aureimonas flava]RIY03704.1 MFS transporter [Aureimonas flava]
MTPSHSATKPPPDDPERIDWMGATAAIASIGAVGLALGLGLPLLSVVLENRGLSASMIGLNTAIAGVASLLAAPGVAPLARRFGVRGTLLLAIVAAALSAVGFHLFQPFWTWFPLRLVFHFSVTVMFILSEFWISSVSPPRRRGLVLGIYATVLALGFALGPFLFSLVGSRGFLPFGLGAGIILLSAVPLFLAGRSEPVLDRGHGASFHRYLWVVPSATCAVLVFGAVESGGLALFPIYGLSIGFSEGGAARLLTAVGLGSVALQIPLGLLSDRVADRRHLLLAFAAVGLVGALLLPLLATNWMLLAVVLFLWGGVVAGLYTVGLAHLGSRLRGADLAAANAAFIFCYSLGMLVGPQGLGVSMDFFGPNGFAYALAAFFAAYLMAIGVRTLRRPS